MKNIIWLSPSLTAGAIAARLVAFFERHTRMSSFRAQNLRRFPAPAGFELEPRIGDQPQRFRSRPTRTPQTERSLPLA
jgi:hypothetical protein